jgi:hypothetical protein
MTEADFALREATQRLLEMERRLKKLEDLLGQSLLMLLLTPQGKI